MDGRLSVEALLPGISSAGDGRIWYCKAAIAFARCANAALRPSLGENSWLRVTGVCVNTETRNWE
jgi:hypothetical protein